MRPRRCCRGRCSSPMTGCARCLGPWRSAPRSPYGSTDGLHRVRRQDGADAATAVLPRRLRGVPRPAQARRRGAVLALGDQGCGGVTRRAREASEMLLRGRRRRHHLGRIRRRDRPPGGRVRVDPAQRAAPQRRARLCAAPRLPGSRARHRGCPSHARDRVRRPRAAPGLRPAGLAEPCLRGGVAAVGHAARGAPGGDRVVQWGVDRRGRLRPVAPGVDRPEHLNRVTGQDVGFRGSRAGYADAMATTRIHYTVPGMSEENSVRLIELLQRRLHAYNDLQLTLKHVHWNVVGPHFIAVHEMIDPQVEAVRGFADDLAERIATLGGSPSGTPGSIVKERAWDDYPLGRAGTQEHLGALDLVYRGVIESYRTGIKELDDLDLVTQDMFIAQTEQLELFHWFIRAHLEDQGGRLSTEGAESGRDAARAAGGGTTENTSVRER